MSTVAQTTFTPDDLLKMPDGDTYELVNGQLVEQAMGAKAGWVSGQIYTLLNLHAKQHDAGWAFPDGTSIQCFPDDPNKVRRPDTCLVARGRFQNDEVPEGHILIPPDLAVEVVSPNDSYYDVEAKVGEYLDAGVKLVWVINPANRTVKVYRAEGDVSHLDEKDQLSGEDVLRGFVCRVGDLFPPAKDS
jgi:Uma2 family endonuclease